MWLRVAYNLNDMRYWVSWILLVLPALQAEPKIPPIRPTVQGVFPHGAQQGTDLALSGADPRLPLVQ